MGYGRGYGRGGRGRGRGRMRGGRWIEFTPSYMGYAPIGAPPYAPPVDVLVEEIEAMRLVDVEGLTQEEAAARMGVSRKTLWNDLKSGRRKVVTAIISGRPIRIVSHANVPQIPQQPPVPQQPSFPPFNPLWEEPPGAGEKAPETAEAENRAFHEILSLLPNINCRACGYPSCADAAMAIVRGEAPPDVCRIVGPRIRDRVVEVLKKHNFPSLSLSDNKNEKKGKRR